MSTLGLDEPAMVVEERRIVATTSGLTEIRVPLATPGTTGDGSLLPQLIYGGELAEPTAKGRGSGTSVGVRLPGPLPCGGGHQFGLSVVRTESGAAPGRVPAGHLYTCPDRCDLFVARVRFSRGCQPTWVRRVDGLLRAELDQPPSREELVPVDSVGEVVARFGELEAGRCYGLWWGRQWTPDDLYRPAGGRHGGAPGGGSLRNR